MSRFIDFFKKNYRTLIQAVFFLYTLGIGARFYFYLNAIESGNFNVIKPYGVEAFLPISALMGLKQLILTGVYDPIHPAGLTILIAAIVMSLLFKKSFCSHICPVGFVSETISRFSVGVKIHRFIHYPLTALKYLLLGFFAYIILWQMDMEAISSFMTSPYNIIADSKMMLFFTTPSVITICVIVALIILTLIFKNFWCRYLCPYGAFLGLFSFLSPFKVKRDKEECIKCMRCSKACPMDIPVDDRKIVLSPECMGCQNCVNHRFNEKCLKLRNFKANSIVYSFAAVSIFLLIFAIAYFSGYWESSVNNAEYYRILQYFK